MTEVTTGLTGEMKTYYDKVFLARAEYDLVLKEGAQMRTHSTGEGKTIWFNRYTPQAIETTALSEGVNPSICPISAANVSVVLAEYGTTYKISRFLSTTSIDVNNREKIALLGQNMGQTMNRIVRNELENGTVRIANGKAASTVAASDVLDGPEVRAIVQQLEINKAKAYAGGYFLGKVNPYTKTTLLKSTAWLNAKTYSDVGDLYKGEMGELYGVRFLNNIDVNSGAGTGSASTVTMYHNYFHGEDAIGCFDLATDQPKLYIVTDKADSGNPAARFGLASWAGTYASKILNSDWVILSKSSTG